MRQAVWSMVHLPPACADAGRMPEQRPSADALLARIKEQERVRLRVYIGAAPGVGKTYEMLRDAHALRARGLDVVVGFVETSARIAGRLGSRWYAVYVETPREKPGRIAARGAEALRENSRLAESLGATVVRVHAAKPVDGLIAFAQREGVTHVVFGQTARLRWELLWHGSSLGGFLRAVPGAAVQVAHPHVVLST